ncbi:MAG: L-histidine N(alpha)-methyltransferase [Beijerinckiaceae bacterium]|nr:L-histidine N(alpha)-methyltransferase [Beijerinckiaceae bacterium]
MTHETHLDNREHDAEFAEAVIEGLGKTKKSLPCRFFYDAAGSEIFERITREPEYYPTRTEAALIAESAARIAERTVAGTVLIEFGSGSSRKTEILLSELVDLAAYVPIDVSGDALREARERLAAKFPMLRVFPIVGDFGADVRLPENLVEAPRLGFFPGSTIGNFTPEDARALLEQFGRQIGSGRLIVGVDLRKDLSVLIPAYNDAAGSTAAFNLNLLTRINRELGADFERRAFRHEAVWNGDEGRIEMHLVSRRRQDVHVLGRTFTFTEGERIHTENSYKYTIDGFREVAEGAGWQVTAVWTDPQGWFSLQELTRN